MASPATAVRAGAGLRLLRAAVFTAVCVVLAAAGHTLASGAPVPVTSLVVGWLAVFAVVAPLAGRERRLPGIAAGLAAGQLTLHTVYGVGQVCATQAVTPSSERGSGVLSLATRLVCGSRGRGLTAQTARQIVTGAGLDPAVSGTPTAGALSGSMSGSMSAAMSGMSGMSGVHDMAGMSPNSGMPGMSASGAPVPGGGAHAMMAALPMCSLPMLLGHLFAALVAGWLLRRGEAALWRLIRLSVRGAAGLATLPSVGLRRAHALLSAPTAGVGLLLVRTGPSTGTAAVGLHRTVWLRHSLERRGPPVVLAAA